MTFGQMLLEMVEGRHVGSSRRPLAAAAATGVVLVVAQAARTAARRPRPSRRSASTVDAGAH
jgi:hypothetical protein